MNGEELKRKLKAGGIVYGTMLTMNSSARSAASISELGLDFVVIDTEHTPRGRDEVANFLVGLKAGGTVPMARVLIPSCHYVTMTLDAGAEGVIAPYCETVEEVKEVVGAAKWRPLKGALLDRAMETGEFPSEASKQYLADRNRNVVCIIGIESVPAIENLGKILEVDGIDAIFVGPNDVSISLGIPNQYEHPEFEAALHRIIEECQAHNTPTMIHFPSLPLSQRWLRRGARFVMYSSDLRITHGGYRQEFNALKAVGDELGDGATERIGESQEVV